MDVVSLGYRTDLTLRRLAGASVTDHGDHLVVRTPDNPGFYWGNFLLLAAPAAPGEAGRWLRVFAAAFPAARHVAIGVDGTDGAVGDEAGFAAAGLEAARSSVLTADAGSVPDRPDDGVEIRALATDADWQQYLDLRRAIDADDDPAQDEFLTRRGAEARRLVERGTGAWFGAVVDGAVRAGLGIVAAGDGLARYQNVETHPSHRRRGLARALLLAAAEHARDALAARTLVIVADPDDVAIRLYRQVGFTDLEQQVELQRSPAAG